MSDAKPCRHLAGDRSGYPECRHPLLVHLLNGGEPYPMCHGCPCHEPEPDESGVKESLTAQPDHIGDTNKMVPDPEAPRRHLP